MMMFRALGAVPKRFSRRRLGANALRPALAADVLHRAADAVIQIDRSDSIVYWNRGATELYGFSSDEALGRSLTELIVPEKFRRRHLEGYDAVMAGAAPKYGHRDILRVPALRKDGSPVPVEFTLQLTTGADGAPETSIAMMRDASKMSETVRALRAKVKTLQKALGEKGRDVGSS